MTGASASSFRGREDVIPKVSVEEARKMLEAYRDPDSES
jgi:hypothetical protein